MSGLPSTIICHNDREFEVQWKRHVAGEIYIHAMNVGASLAEWVLEVSYPQAGQQDLFSADELKALRETGI